MNNLSRSLTSCQQAGAKILCRPQNQILRFCYNICLPRYRWDEALLNADDFDDLQANCCHDSLQLTLLLII